MLYITPWSIFELTTSMVIGTDCIGSCKSNYHTITTTTPPPPKKKTQQKNTTPQKNRSSCKRIIEVLSHCFQYHFWFCSCNYSIKLIPHPLCITLSILKDVQKVRCWIKHVIRANHMSSLITSSTTDPSNFQTTVLSDLPR